MMAKKVDIGKVLMQLVTVIDERKNFKKVHLRFGKYRTYENIEDGVRDGIVDRLTALFEDINLKEEFPNIPLEEEAILENAGYAIEASEGPLARFRLTLN